MEVKQQEWTKEEVQKKINEVMLKADEANIRANGAAIKGDEIVKKLAKKPTYTDVILASVIVVIVAFLVNGFVFEFRYKDEVARKMHEMNQRVQVLEQKLGMENQTPIEKQ